MPIVGFEPTIPVFGGGEDISCLKLSGHCELCLLVEEEKTLPDRYRLQEKKGKKKLTSVA
jgi:hypothetical protein